MKKLFSGKNRIFGFGIISLVILSAVLRLICLEKYPPSLNWDEVSHGYNAYSILKTGKDEWGVVLPTIFRAYGDYKLPVYIYTTAISVFVFGLNAFAVRLPSALAGVGTVIFTYLLSIELFDKKWSMVNGQWSKNKLPKSTISYQLLAIIAALLVAIEPWSLFLSRGAFEANLALFLFVGGLYFLFLGLKKPKYLLIASLFLGLNVWTYNSYRIFTLPALLSFIIIYKKQLTIIWKKNKKHITLALVILTAFFIPMFVQLSNNVGQSRYSKVSIINEGTINKINEQRAKADLSPVVERIIYNKGWYFLGSFVNNWISHYTPDFLFIKGGDQYQFSILDHGLIYLVNAPFLLIGLILLIKAAWKKEESAMFLLSWFLLAPIPASITRESPHVLRTITMLPVPMMITSYGFFKTISSTNLRRYLSGKVFVALYFAVLIIAFGNYLLKYTNDYSKNYSWSWQYGYKETVDYVKSVYGKYDKIIFTKKYGEPHEFVLFYWPWDPKAYQNDPSLIRFYQSDWYWVDKFDKFYFVNDWDITKESDEAFVLESGGEFGCETSKCLLVTSPGNYHKDWKLVKTIYFLDRKPAFEILGN